MLISKRTLFKVMAMIHIKGEIRNLREAFATFQKKLQIYAISNQVQQFPVINYC